MNRFLPKSIIFFSLLLVVLGFFVFVTPSSAQPQPTVTPTITPSLTPTPTVPSSLQQNTADPASLSSDWIIDPEVTSIGKNAARAGLFLDWALQNYNWESVSAGKTSPLIPFWVTIRNIVYSFLILVIIAGSLVLIVTRGRSVTLRKFIPRFLLIAILVTFSFAFVEFLYQIVDVFQGFFISPGGVAISQKDLLFVGWTYKDFVGLRALGDANFESAFVSLLLVKLTSFTYYAMVGILLVRKIILWFFIMVSPFFPLLLLFYPLRNTAKIWLGEFFRWLLYAPLFAIFLAGLVSLWKIGIPLSFNFDDAKNGLVVFPTAVSILLGGPLQNVGIANSVNLADTFGLYLVALLMLWMVIIFPFILLQIFLDYISNFNVNQNAFARQMMNMISHPPSPKGSPPPSPVGAGLARSLPFFRDFATPKPVPATTGLAREIPRQFQAQTQQQTQNLTVKPVSLAQKESIEKLTNITIPTLRDIARYDSSSIRRDTEKQKEIERIKENLANIHAPASVSDTLRREKYQQLRESLLAESKTGNPVATTYLNAAKTVGGAVSSVVNNAGNKTTSMTTVLTNLSRPEKITNTIEREKYVELKEKLVKETNSSFASTVLSAIRDASSASSSSLTSLLTSLRSQEIHDEKTASLKEAVTKESQQGNAFASTMEGAIKEQSDGKIQELQQALEKEKAAGNPLAVQILALTTKKSDQQDKKIEQLTSEIQKEKEKGNQLAVMLSDLMTTKAESTSLPAALPKANRIQEVSLDDYEAVKKMWTENYEQETDQSAEEKKRTIEEEMRQIDDTIGLLTSEDKEKVEEGMQKVSDILPFLLIGGFSTTEIVAYLKAKQAAGEDVLKDIVKKSEEDETMLETTRTASVAPKTQTVSVAIPETHTLEAVERNNTPTVQHAHETVSQPKFLAGPSRESTQMLRLANIAIPSLKTIASYDEALVSKDTKREQEMQRVEQTLRRIANPNTALDTSGREQYTQIRDSLVSEGKKGNSIASAIVSAGKVTDKLSVEELFGNVLKLAAIIRELRNPDALTDQKEKAAMLKLRETLMLQQQNGNSLAGEMSSLLQMKTDPTPAQTLLLLSSLEGAAKEGDPLAVSLIEQANSVVEEHIASSRDELVGMYTMLSSISQEKKEKNVAAGSLRSIISKKAEEGNQLAKEVLAQGDTMQPASVINLTSQLQTSKDPFAKELLGYASSFTTRVSESKDNSLLSLFKRLFTPSDDKQAHEANEQIKLLQKAAKEGNALATLFLTKTDEATRLQIKSLSEILREVADPSSLPSLDQESFKDLGARLQKAALSDNQLAYEILSVAKVLGEKDTKLTMLDKTTLCVLLWQTLTAETVNGDSLAEEVVRLAKKRTTRVERLSQIADLLDQLSDLNAVKDADRRQRLIDFKNKIVTQQELNNPLAVALGHAIADPKKTRDNEVLALLEKRLEEEENIPFVKDFLSLLSRDESESSFAMLRVLKYLGNPELTGSEDEKQRYLALRKTLEDASRRDSSVSMSLLAAAERIRSGDDIAEARKAEVLLSREDSETTKQIRATIEKEKNSYREIMILRGILHDMLNPSYIVDEQVKKSYEALNQSIAIEASHTNPVAKALQKALSDIGTNESVEDEITRVSALYQVLRVESEHGNNRASEMLALVSVHALRDKAQRLVLVLESIWDNKRVNGLDRDMYQKVRDELVTARDGKDETATLLLSIAQSLSDGKVASENADAIVELLFKKLTIEEKRGNTFAQSILALMKPSVEKEKSEIERAIQEAEKTNNALLAPLLDELSETSGVTPAPINLLPSENKVQEVSVEDYESVRSMWAESFSALPVPSTLNGERLTRVEWLQRQVTQISAVIDLLTSQDKLKMQQGMRHIDGILPFLLVGGFSLEQIVSYLKAKREAAKTVLAQLNLSSDQTIAGTHGGTEQKMQEASVE